MHQKQLYFQRSNLTNNTIASVADVICGGRFCGVCRQGYGLLQGTRTISDPLLQQEGHLTGPLFNCCVVIARVSVILTAERRNRLTATLAV